MKPYYTDSHVTIYHGDCREVLPVECDVIVSDPPYAMTVHCDKFKQARDGFQYWHGVEHSGGVAVDLLLSMRKPMALFGANGYASRLPDHPGWIVWDKQADGFAQGSPAELAWSNYLTNLRIFRMNYRGFTLHGDPKFHPMQKPLALMRWVLTLRETPVGTVLDPYMGSGTTLVAAKGMDRRAVGIEVEERYCEIAAKRLAAVVPEHQGALFVADDGPVSGGEIQEALTVVSQQPRTTGKLSVFSVFDEQGKMRDGSAGY